MLVCNLFVQPRDLSAARDVRPLKRQQCATAWAQRLSDQGVRGDTAGEHIWVSPWPLYQLENKSQLLPHQGCTQDEGTGGSLRSTRWCRAGYDLPSTPLYPILVWVYFLFS